MKPHLALPLLAAALLPTPSAAKAKPKNAILLSDVQSLTLRHDAQTAHRRVSAVPQLKCVSSPTVCRLHAVDTMRCTNQGSGYDDEDIQWSCAASLPPELKLGSTDVICEGYAGPDDPYVLKGSCGVEYRLVLTDLGEKKFPEIAKGGRPTWGGGSNGGKKGDTDWSAVLFGVLFVGVCIWILVSACTQASANRRQTPGQRRGGGGGGGGGGGPGFGGGDGGGWFNNDTSDDPPPPYSKSTRSSSSRGSSRSNNNAQEGWRPGFWTGLAGGSAAGYAAGSRASRNNNNSTGGYGGGGWGSGGESSSSSSGWGSGSGSGSTSSARYESTGFGSTNRR
ncbi:hypothetical protein F4778DRAFT_139771 [Xylariomycetidae sp. FL2044]|nr:hypothetical protein F4778DRAFT_139771 [Xylariomycetidae sp. FL2044]